MTLQRYVPPSGVLRCFCFGLHSSRRRDVIASRTNYVADKLFSERSSSTIYPVAGCDCPAIEHASRPM